MRKNVQILRLSMLHASRVLSRTVAAAVRYLRPTQQYVVLVILLILSQLNYGKNINIKLFTSINDNPPTCVGGGGS